VKFSISRCQNVNILEKSRAARAMKLTSDHPNHDVATATAKNEDAVKMTLSVLGFLSRIGDKR
jgi:hypothetical protein